MFSEGALNRAHSWSWLHKQQLQIEQPTVDQIECIHCHKDITHSRFKLPAGFHHETRKPVKVCSLECRDGYFDFCSKLTEDQLVKREIPQDSLISHSKEYKALYAKQVEKISQTTCEELYDPTKATKGIQYRETYDTMLLLTANDFNTPTQQEILKKEESKDHVAIEVLD